MNRMHASTRTVFKAMGVFGSVKALSVLFSLIRNKLIAVWIGPAGVGLVILYNSIADVVSTTTRLNIDQSAIRDISGASNQQTADTAYVVYRWAFLLGIVGFAVMCALSPLLSRWSFGHSGKWWSFCLMGLVPLCGSVGAGYNAVMQGLRKFDSFARCGVVTAVGGIICAVPLLWFLRERAIVWVIVSYAMWAVGASYYYHVRLPRISLPWKEIWMRGTGFVRLGALITAGLAIGQLFSYLFVLYLNSYADTSTLGLFQAGYTIINTYVGIIFTGMWVEYFPHLTAVIHSPRRVSTIVSHRIALLVWILVPVMALFIALDDLLVRIVYAESFLTMLPYITIGMAGMALRMTSWCVALTIVAKGDGHIYVITETISGLCCLIFNIIGYSFGGFPGLGAAYVLWYGVYLAISIIVYRRVYGFHLRGRVLQLTLLATVFAVAAVGARYVLGWWAPLLLGVAVLPLAFRRITANR